MEKFVGGQGVGLKYFSVLFGAASCVEVTHFTFS